MARHKKQINIKLVAEEAGVSLATVSRVINNRTDVSEAMRVAIEKTRETDGYTWDEDTEFVLEVHYGKGTWEGVPEDSAMISVRSHAPITHLHSLRRELGELADKYGQDAIALTIGTSELC